MVLPLKGGKLKEVCGSKARVPLPKKGGGEGTIGFEAEFSKHGQGVQKKSSGVTCPPSCASYRSLRNLQKPKEIMSSPPSSSLKFPNDFLMF